MAIGLVVSGGSSRPRAVHIAPVNVGRVPPAHARSRGTRHAGLIPTRVRIPTLDVAATVVRETVSPAGVLGVPDDARTLGWWSGGARPGATRGTAVIDGHINWSGVDGALAHVTALRPGDPIIIQGVHDRAHFTVTGVRTYEKFELPWRRIFSQHAAGRIAFITCGGAYDAASGHYQDNIVVYAVPTRTPAPR